MGFVQCVLGWGRGMCVCREGVQECVRVTGISSLPVMNMGCILRGGGKPASSKLSSLNNSEHQYSA